MVDKVSGFICLTEFFSIKMREAGVPESKLFVRPNFVDAPAFPADQKTADNYALFMGRLSPEKGCWTLIRAFEQLPHVQLKIVGTGPLEQEFRRLHPRQGNPEYRIAGLQERDGEVGDPAEFVLPGAAIGVV